MTPQELPAKARVSRRQTGALELHRSEVVLSFLREYVARLHSGILDCMAGCRCANKVGSAPRRAHAVFIEDLTLHLLLQETQPLFVSPKHVRTIEQWQAGSRAFARYVRDVFAATEHYLARIAPASVDEAVDHTGLGIGKPRAAWVICRFVVRELAGVCVCQGPEARFEPERSCL
jgi:hypothetical protein